jgi:NAD(P) transhydrogenase
VEVRRAGGDSVNLNAERILIATGSRPFHPPGMPFDHPDVLDSDTARHLDRSVGTLTVIGGGAVACEYASIFAAVGTDVTLVESSGRPLPFMDGELVRLMVESFRALGVRMLFGVGRAQVAADDSGPRTILAEGTELRSDKVIVAAGRVGNTENLGLKETGVAVDERGLVLVDEHQATSVPGIYAAGDVTGPPALASVSMEQGRVAACHAFGVPLRDRVDTVAPFGVYSIPEAAMVGLTEEGAKEAGIDIVVGRARLARNPRSVISGATDGIVKLIFRTDDSRLIGAHILGDNATELIHQAQAVMHFGGTVDYFVGSTYNVPTQSEAFKYAAYDGLSRLQDHPTLTSYV